MAKKYPTIPPFPADIDRESFGHWLSGFVDGEGCFQLREGRGRVAGFVTFQIKLRRDDRVILQQIQSFWQCGLFAEYELHRVGNGGRRPSVEFRVSRLRDLVEVIAPHFEKFPLRAKKNRDFIAWRNGLDFCWEIHCQRPASRQRIGRRGERFLSWTSQNVAKFHEFAKELRRVRSYEFTEFPSTPVPQTKQDVTQQTLW